MALSQPRPIFPDLEAAVRSYLDLPAIDPYVPLIIPIAAATLSLIALLIVIRAHTRRSCTPTRPTSPAQPSKPVIAPLQPSADTASPTPSPPQPPAPPWRPSRAKPNYHQRAYDPLQQIRDIQDADFRPRRLINHSELEVFHHLERIAASVSPDFRVFAQTSLGEVLQTTFHSESKEKRDRAYRAINTKRLDFLVIDQNGLPVLGVEYHGGGHFQDDAFVRDTVKREALRKASIRFIEIQAHDEPHVTETRIAAELRQHLRNSTPSRTQHSAIHRLHPPSREEPEESRGS